MPVTCRGMSQTITFSIQHEVQLRFLSPKDIPEVKLLCVDWFPIEYPDTWYQDITSNPKFYTLAATYNSRIIGLIVSEVKHKSRVNREDADILAAHFSSGTQVAYILTLGVVADFRRHGIASMLLDTLLSYLTSSDHLCVKAVFLHVLTTNTTAIRFYERRSFKVHSFLPFYYSIKGQPRDGYSYVLYINGGEPPWSILDYIKHLGLLIGKLQPCALPRRVLRSVHNLWRRMLTSSSMVNHAPHIS